MFTSKTKTVSVKVQSRTRVYDVKGGGNLDFNLLVKNDQEGKNTFDYSPGFAKARVTITVDYFVEGELE